jgi:hypothetical protein
MYDSFAVELMENITVIAVGIGEDTVVRDIVSKYPRDQLE